MKELFLIQQALHDDVFPQISTVETSHGAWEILQKEYMGDEKAAAVKLKILCHDFDTLLMKSNDYVHYMSRVSSIDNIMKLYGKNISDEIVVGKVLRSLLKKIEHVVAAIEESKDLSDYLFYEPVDSLFAHEYRINMYHNIIEEKPFYVKEESTFSKEKSSIFSCNFIGRGKFYGPGKGSQFNDILPTKSDFSVPVFQEVRSY